MDSHQSGPRRALSQPSGGRRVRPLGCRLPHTPGTPLASATQGTEAAGPPDRLRHGGCRLAFRGGHPGGRKHRAPRVKPPFSGNPATASARRLSQDPDSRPGLPSWGPNSPRAVPEGAAPPPPDGVSCRGGGGHSSDSSDASHKNNNLLEGDRSRKAEGGGAPRCMPGLVVPPAPYTGRRRREELRLPKRSAVRRRQAAGSWAPGPWSS